MRQTLALLLVLALVGTVLANARELPERRRKEMAKKYSTMQRVKSLNPGMMGSQMDFRRTQELTKKAQKAGVNGLREKFNSFKAAPNADEINKMRNRMAAQMNIKGMKAGMKKRSSMRKPVF